MQSVLRRLSPLEIVAAGMAAIALGLSFVFGLHFYRPDMNSAHFAMDHYVLPLLAALVVAWWRSRASGNSLLGLVVQFRQLLAFSVVVYLHFCLKLWSLLINDMRFDDYYRHIDVTLGVTEKLLDLYQPIGLGVAASWPHAYHDIFIGMFLVSLTVHATQGHDRGRLDQLSTALACVLAVGGLSYIVAPAFGPFVFGPGSNSTATAIQLAMLEFSNLFAASLGDQYSGSQFVMPLGAMPSLHIAHSLVMLFHAWGRALVLRIAYIPVTAFFALEAMSARWHYFIDLVAGFAIVLCATGIARTLCARHRAARLDN